MNARRTLAILLLLTMLTTCLGLNTALAQSEEPVTLTIFTSQHPYVEDYVDNKFTKLLEKDLNVKIEWQIVPAADMNQKVNLILSSNTDLPDIFMTSGITNEQAFIYGSQGTFLPLNDYLEKSGVYAKQAFAEAKERGLDVMSAITMPDGNIYQLPVIVIWPPNQLAKRMYINQKWLDALDLAMPTTTDELFDVLMAFKTRDPNGNGLADEIPFTGATDGWHTTLEALMNAFIFSNGSYMYLDDGKVVNTFTQDAYRDGVAFLKKLVDNGLLDPAIFTQNNDTLKQLVSNEDAALVGALVSGGMFNQADRNSERFRDYVNMPALKGPSGAQYMSTVTYDTSMNMRNATLITTACKNPDKAFELLDYMYKKEVSVFNRYGEYGVDWVTPEGDVKDLRGEKAIRQDILAWGSMQKANWAMSGPYYNWEEYIYPIKAADPFDVETQLYEAYQKNLPYAQYDMVVPPLIPTIDDINEFAELKVAITDAVKQNFARFVVGDRPLDEWDAYLSELEILGLKRYEEIQQAAYDIKYKG